MLRKQIAVLLMLPITALVCTAQEAPKPQPLPKKFYRLDFVFQEVDGTKVVNSRAYSATSATDSDDFKIQTNSIVPVPVGSPSNTAQYQKIAIGFDIFASHLQEREGQLALQTVAIVTSMPEDTPQNSYPVTRRNEWHASLLIPLRKPTIIFSSDDLTTKHKMQMQLTATPIQ